MKWNERTKKYTIERMKVGIATSRTKMAGKIVYQSKNNVERIKLVTPRHNKRTTISVI